MIAHLEEIVMQGSDLGQFVNDFTWYMRNLLLIKASDNMEEILDVSAENLIQLKEEAGMIRQDTLMRFIRIFSELTNQLKNASNKRILVEMALIKPVSYTHLEEILCTRQIDSHRWSAE